MPFLYIPNNSSIDNNTISYSILWTLRDIQPGEFLERDYLPNVTE